MEFKGLKYLLFDIEGTVSDINFVKKIMFPYSEKALPGFIKEHGSKPKIQEILNGITAEQLLAWIQSDTKHPALKSIQGLIWKEAFEKAVFKAPLYSDVLPNWSKWSEQGFNLGIYSSGSITAQKMFFTYSTEGNLLPMLCDHFDLSIGGKKESQSYFKIADKLGLKPEEILFFSDVPEELVAAQKTDIQVAHIVREGTEASTFPSIHSFSDLELLP